MTVPLPSTEALHHHVRRMGGRDPHEEGRVASNLELLFDLTFATSFGFAAAQFAHALAAGEFAAALIGFGFASFAISWAWINFSWFSSAYDTDDWIYRLVTMVQMIGVLVLAIGLPRMFASLEHGDHMDNSVIVFGYVIMRLAMVFQWLRAARQDPPRRRACLAYASAISIAQVGWVAQIFLDLTVWPTLAISGVLLLIELAGPYIAERIDGGTPWHAHHIAERYSLFAIIALGEGVVGSVAAISAVVESQGWSVDAALISIAGVGLTFGVWWVYYMLPSAEALHAHRDRSFVWGYGQMVTIASIVAIGAGLHVAAFYIEGKAEIGPAVTALAVAIPVSVYLTSIYLLYYYLLRGFDRLHVFLFVGTAAVATLSILAAVAGVDMAVCLVILMLAPAVTVVGYEVSGHRYAADALAAEEGGSP